MLKVYTMNCYVSINGGEWKEVDDGFYPYFLRDDSKPIIETTPKLSFEECCDYLKEHKLIGVSQYKNILKKQRIIIMYSWSYDTRENYKNFDSLEYKITFKEAPHVTLKEIFTHFPADKCIQYLKERGITTCPMNF